MKLDKDNGANGKCPVFPSEFRAAGLGNDLRCYELIDFVYR